MTGTMAICNQFGRLEMVRHGRYIQCTGGCGVLKHKNLSNLVDKEWCGGQRICDQWKLYLLSAGVFVQLKMVGMSSRLLSSQLSCKPTHLDLDLELLLLPVG